MWGSMNFIWLSNLGSRIEKFGFQNFKTRNSFRRRRHVAEDHLHLFGAIGAVGQEHLEGLTKFDQTGVLAQGFGAIVAAADSVKVGGEGEGSPAHLEELLFQYVFCVSHITIVSRISVFVLNFEGEHA